MPPRTRFIAKLAAWIPVVVIATAPLPGQDVPRVQLKVKERLPVSSVARYIATIGQTCDNEGNIYYRRAMPAPADPLSAPITRISADGRQVADISLRSAEGFGDDVHIHAWAVGLRGEVHMIADKDVTPKFVHYGGGDIYFVHFDSDGQFESSAKLDSRFYVEHLAVFPSGEEFLTVAKKVAEKPGDPGGEPLTAIFDRNGKFIKELSFAGDVKPKPGTRPDQQGTAIDLGDAVPAEDGNIYLMRATEKPLIFVISPAGEVVRRLQLDPPGERFQSSSMKVAGGNIIVEFYRPNPSPQHSGTNLYSMYDAQTGQRQIDYEPPAETYGIFACYTPNQFTLLSEDDNGLAIVHAAPR